MSVPQQALVQGVLAKNGVPPGNVIYSSLYRKVPNLDVYEKKSKKHKTTPIPRSANLTAARHEISQAIETLKPKLIVVNDEATLRAITGQPYTLATTRGSVYKFDNVGVLVLDDLRKLQYDPISKFTTQLDFGKLVRHATGRAKKAPPFHYHLVRSVAEVEAHCDRAERATLVGVDTETASKFITVVAYTYDCDGMLFTFSVPFFDPAGPDGAYWSYNDEVAVRQRLAKLHASPVIKALQNGAYDMAYFVKENMPMFNWFINTDILMHSIWIEAPKSLHMLASYWVDDYTYWKDDGKGIKQENWGKTRGDILRYWRYCGMDTYYTYLVAYYLLAMLVKQKWAMNNYKQTFALEVGPCLEASLTGIAIDKDAHSSIMEKQIGESIKGIADVRALTGEPGFNVKSPRDVAWFLYDFCQQKPTRLQWTDPTKKGNRKFGPRSTDEKVLKIMKEQNNVLSPIARNFIDRLLKAKKPGNILSNYQNLNFLTMRDRFCAQHHAAGTDTFRFATGGNQFWIGRNDQNIPEPLREWLVADPDWIMWSIDYSASDDRFIAYESEDPAKMELVESGKDPHCFHASIFFGKPYEEIYEGWKKKLPEIVHSTRGIRQNTKRVTHGRNFRMEAGTMYNTMGRDAVVATAIMLGNPTAAKWTDKELIGICQQLIEKYDNQTTGLYKRLRPWGTETVEACIKNGNKMTNCFGQTRWFLGDMKQHDTQRELASCYGQMGTSGNINRALIEAYYSGVLDKDMRFLQQGHDSLLGIGHKSKLHEKLPQLIKIMEATFQIHGRTIRIPTDAKVGFRWSENMIGYTPEITYEKLQEVEQELFAKKYPRRNSKQDIIDALSNLDLSGEINDIAADMGLDYDGQANDDMEEIHEVA